MVCRIRGLGFSLPLPPRPQLQFFCSLFLRRALVEAYYRSVSLWLPAEGMGLVAWKSKQPPVKHVPENSSGTADLRLKWLSPKPSWGMCSTFFLCIKQGIQLSHVRFWVAGLELGLHEVAYESKLKKRVPWTLARWKFWLFLGFTFNLLLESLWSSFSLWARSSQLISSLCHRLMKWNPSHSPVFWSVMQHDACSGTQKCSTMNLLSEAF